MLPTGVEEITHTQTMLDKLAMAVLYLLRACRSMMCIIIVYVGMLVLIIMSGCILQSSMTHHIPIYVVSMMTEFRRGFAL